MNDWLYPISKRAGRDFVDARGRSVPVSYESFRDFVITGRIQDDIWYIATGFRAMKPGDRLWIYTGDRNIGVIGLATANSIDAPSSRRKAAVHLHWRFAESRRLVADPLPAQIVRKYVHYPRRPVINLAPHAPLLRQLSKWTASRAKSDRAALKPLRLKPIREIWVEHKSKHYRALLDHDALLGPIQRRLKRSGYHVGLIDTGKTQVDLAARKGTGIVLVEAKKVTSPTGRPEGRAAFAQLHEYRWSLNLRQRTSPRFVLWAAFSRRPASDVVQFLEDSGILVSSKGTNARISFSAESEKRADTLISGLASDDKS